MTRRPLKFAFSSFAICLAVGCARPAVKEAAAPPVDRWAGQPVEVEFGFEGAVAFVAKGLKESQATQLVALLPEAGEGVGEPAVLAKVDAAARKQFYCGVLTRTEPHFAQIAIPFASVKSLSGLPNMGGSELILNLSGADPFDRTSMDSRGTFNVTLEPNAEIKPVTLTDFNRLPSVMEVTGTLKASESHVLPGATDPTKSLPEVAARLIFGTGERFVADEPIKMKAKDGQPAAVPVGWVYRTSAGAIEDFEGPSQSEIAVRSKVLATRIGSPRLVVTRGDGKTWHVDLVPNAEGRVRLEVRNLRGAELIKAHTHMALNNEAPRTADNCQRLEHSKLFTVISQHNARSRKGPFLFPELKLAQSPAGFCVPGSRLLE